MPQTPCRASRRVGGYSFVVKDAVGHKVTLKCTAEDHTSWMQAFKRVHSLSRRIHDFYEVGHVVGEGATCKVYEAWCKVRLASLSLAR